MVKDDFQVASSGEYPAIEKFGNGFIIVYQSITKIKKILCDGNYSIIADSDVEINGVSSEFNPWISKLSNGTYIVCYDKQTSNWYIFC